ncbi:MAG TPA: hypothetical protein PK156_31110 [Polyangium sp.]|nr:hypothetical protein [Polyangium sp.]
MAKRPQLAERISDAVEGDVFDVPAAVLCAICGQADCPGCTPADDDASGVVAIIPWERPGAGTWSRLWSTALATTQGAEAFFGAIPDGPLPPAMRFAVLCEMLAVASMVAALLPLAALALPNLAMQVIVDPNMRERALQWFAIGVPSLALWMVIAHASHGAALDVGARRVGGRPQRRRALRYGLYACGWDLMTGPLGAVWMLFSRGMKATGDIMALAMTVPSKASRALLSGVYGLPEEDVAQAHRWGTKAAIILAVISAFGLLVGIALS